MNCWVVAEYLSLDLLQCLHSVQVAQLLYGRDFRAQNGGQRRDAHSLGIEGGWVKHTENTDYSAGKSISVCGGADTSIVILWRERDGIFKRLC